MRSIPACEGTPRALVGICFIRKPNPPEVRLDRKRNHGDDRTHSQNVLRNPLTGDSTGRCCMGLDRVRIDYEILFQIAQAFVQQADAVRKTQEQLEQAVNTLQQGDWVGKGADKFYGEFTSAVLPAVKRLASA